MTCSFTVEGGNALWGASSFELFSKLDFHWSDKIRKVRWEDAEDEKCIKKC
jgi:hypothetical protein